ncbi:amidase domain-containing protein [Clostridium algidicarnis]|uniref:Zinc carboxypeptidase n=1 Tax=Clostridium algidicarnis DSM 15099 TaxID=1121295 RepID=A0A2S6FUU1_9CLOT|nr:amidase domain-containing protein [Clostridium algidicarnis]PPK44663.1 zinc carboxypeptidase [Clostridium algidicarnis DSM 15099]
MGKYYPNVNPGELVPGGFTYPNNAKLQGDFLYLRDANKNMVSGRQVDDGDSITVLDVGYSHQLALVQYPTSAGVRQGYVNNTPSVIKYNDANAWANGSTTEIVYDENGGQLGSLSPYESATPLYKKNGMTHVVYNTDKGPNTKSGYVKYEGGSVTKITIPKPSTSGVSTISYGKSGKERDLTAYKIGNGNNSLVMVCEVHGFEDNFPKDGLELVNIGNDLIRSLASNGTKGWSVYVIPAANPDGLAEGYTNYGPGRCTIVGGVDINRDFPIGFTPHGTSRNWTGDKPLSVNESKKLSEFIQGIKNKTSGKMVVIDLHGWEGAAIGNPEIGQYFRNQFGFEQRSGYGEDKGFLIAWAKSIGADAALIELPKNTHSHSDVINGGYSQKIINAVNGILSNNPGGGSTGSEVNPPNYNLYIDGKYNRTSAIEYATNPEYSSPGRQHDYPENWPSWADWETHTRKHNKDFERFDNYSWYLQGHTSGSDCANFISQVLFAGGVKQTNDWYFKWDLIPSGMAILKVANFSGSWVRPKEQFDYLKSKGYINGDLITLTSEREMKEAVQKFGIQVGDLMYLSNDKEKFHHIVVITKIHDNIIYFSAHSNDRINEKLTDKDFFVDDAFIVAKIK